MLYAIPTVLRTLIATFIWSKSIDNTAAPLRFHLRHEHAVSNDSRIVFSNIVPSFFEESYQISTTKVKAHRPTSFTAFSNARTRSLRQAQTMPLHWADVEVPGPDVQKRENLQLLAKMTYNSYFAPGDKEWYELGPGWNSSYPFGWEPDADGFRGHIFVSEDNSTVVISIKGTSAGWVAGGSSATTKKDKINDNLLFSCCCARVGPTWSPVCDCYSGGYRCDQTCVERSLIEESLFYPIGTNLYNNITYMYPDANIWVTGHSLGGALASLVGVTFGAPVVAFEAPGEKMAAKRLHLPSPPSAQHITHIYHTADPVAMGTCTGITSSCAIGGYAMESRCHLGKSILYDTVGKLDWSVDIRTHPIKVVIEKILNEDWDPENGVEVPAAEEEKDCVDCFNWEYGDYKNLTRHKFPHWA
ncbi:Alpha/Beta hydrolase protein [Collybia nuda]|uniref:triacylglycerol lipase n=1 Tax=Collybia nuda TaxID=64659 RepID=A0A9P5Y6Z5_9AGAR|nr:Alpha/Beta hydrolase protein [Collybia nuda]